MARPAEALLKPDDKDNAGVQSQIGNFALKVIQGGLSLIPSNKEKGLNLSDEGYFPKGRSMLREIHSNHVVGMHYGQRALLIGATDPRNYVGTSEHTKSKDAPFTRLARTARAFETIFFESKEEADSKLAEVREIHEKYVHGQLSEDAGPYKAGTPYSAMDPEMMLWTVVCMADSAQTLYETLVRRLSEQKREAFWQDYRLLGELFGLPRDNTPGTYNEFREYYDGRLNGNELYLTESAKFTGRQVCFNPPVHPVIQPAREMQNLILLGTVPKQIRNLYGFGWSPVQERAFQAAALNSRLLHNFVPRGMQHKGGNSFTFNKIVEEERRRRQNGTAVKMPENAYRLADS